MESSLPITRGKSDEQQEGYCNGRTELLPDDRSQTIFLRQFPNHDETEIQRFVSLT